MPVVATDSGGVTEILGPDPEQLGAIVPVDDAEALAAAIVRTVERRASFDPLVLRASVERRFGAEYVAERLYIAYRDVLATWPAADPGTRTDGTTGLDDRPPNGDSPSTTPAGGLGQSVDGERFVVVGLDRATAARRLAVIGADLRGRVVLVTSREPRATALPDVDRVIEVEIEPRWQPTPRTGRATQAGWLGRLFRLGSDPVGTLRRRQGSDADPAGWLAPATAAVRHYLAEAGGNGVELIPLDGHDVLALKPLGGGTAPFGGGGLQSVADHPFGASAG
jgi:hypothetical protein